MSLYPAIPLSSEKQVTNIQQTLTNGVNAQDILPPFLMKAPQERTAPLKGPNPYALCKPTSLPASQRTVTSKCRPPVFRQRPSLRHEGKECYSDIRNSIKFNKLRGETSNSWLDKPPRRVNCTFVSNQDKLGYLAESRKVTSMDSVEGDNDSLFSTSPVKFLMGGYQEHFP